MKGIISTVFIALVLAFASASVSSGKGYDGHFGDMDSNKDSAVTWEEFKAFFVHAEKEKFEEADASKDGKVDHGEWHKFKEKYGYVKKAECPALQSALS